MSGSPEQRARLPKWARQELHRLEGDLAYWEAQATAGPEDSDTFVVRGFYPRQRMPLGKDQTIEFQFGPHDTMEVRREGEGLLVRGLAHGLVILPSASNTIYVERRP